MGVPPPPPLRPLRGEREIGATLPAPAPGRGPWRALRSCQGMFWGGGWGERLESTLEGTRERLGWGSAGLAQPQLQPHFRSTSPRW